MKRVIGNIIFVIYAIIAVFVTVCLLSYNDYKISEFGSNSLIIIDNNSLEPNFYSGDLVIVNGRDKIKEGDDIFFYNIEENNVEVTYGKVTNIGESMLNGTTYTINNQLTIEDDIVVGSAESAKRISGVGSVLSILESKWGFLFLIVFPSLIAFVYEIYIVVMEVKESKDDNNKKTTKNDKNKKEKVKVKADSKEE